MEQTFHVCRECRLWKSVPIFALQQTNKKATMLKLSQEIVVKYLNFYNNIVRCYENYFCKRLYLWCEILLGSITICCIFVLVFTNPDLKLNWTIFHKESAQVLHIHPTGEKFWIHLRRMIFNQKSRQPRTQKVKIKPNSSFKGDVY